MAPLIVSIFLHSLQGILDMSWLHLCEEFSYGKLEMRAKIDTRPGAWASWWAVGDFDAVPWPKNGEIDIMDAFQGERCGPCATGLLHTTHVEFMGLK